MEKRSSLILIPLILLACTDNPGKNTAEKIDYIVQESFEDNEFIGNVLVTDHGKIIYQRSFGMANSDAGIQNTDTTRFLIASLSKPITVVLILKLAERGIVDLDDPIRKYFSKADKKAGSITIHQLLTHTSGLNELISEEKGMQISSLLENATLKFKPGTDFEYCNSGYVILKGIAEAATHKEFAQLLSEEIFDPAGMPSSGVARNAGLSRLAKGYQKADQSESVTISFPVENIDGAGSVYATAEDLYRLDRALYTDTLLSAKMRELMLKQHVPEKYSYGWFVKERGGAWDVYWHKGNLPGFTSYISRSVNHDRCIVLLSNAQDLELNDLENDIAKILRSTE